MARLKTTRVFPQPGRSQHGIMRKKQILVVFDEIAEKLGFFVD